MFQSINSVRVINGSLEETETPQQALVELFQIAAQMPSDFSLTDIMEDYFKSKGLNIDSYKSTPDEALLKSILQTGIPMAQAKDLTMKLIQEGQMFQGVKQGESK